MALLVMVTGCRPLGFNVGEMIEAAVDGKLLLLLLLPLLLILLNNVGNCDWGCSDGNDGSVGIFR